MRQSMEMVEKPSDGVIAERKVSACRLKSRNAKECCCFVGGDIAFLDTFGSDKRCVNPHLPLRGNSTFGSQNSTFSFAQLASFNKISENSKIVDPKRLDHLQMLLSPALSSRASLPSTIPIKVEQANLLEFRSQDLDPIYSRRIHLLALGSSWFHLVAGMLLQLLPILLMRKMITCRYFLTSFFFLHTVSNLAMWNSKLPISSKQSLGSLEFAGRKSAAASISIPAGVLADSFSDWIRESLPSDSNESHRCCGFAPEGSDLDAQSDTALAHMDRSIRSKVINPENNNRASTSSSEYFLPYKASSRKRKLSGNTKESQESILNEADVESQSVIISSLSQSMLKIVLQHHLRST
nr:hypothetical transcript [Hymenolepis microstoma]